MTYLILDLLGLSRAFDKLFGDGYAYGDGWGDTFGEGAPHYQDSTGSGEDSFGGDHAGEGHGYSNGSGFMYRYP